MSERVRVGVGAIVLSKDKKILLGKRLATYNNGLWAVPAGHVEFGETFTEAVKRELLEETGLRAKRLELIGLNNSTDSNKERQYVNIDFLVFDFDGSLENREPDLCEGWKWFSVGDLPSPLSPPTEIAIKSLATGKLCVTENESFEIGQYRSLLQFNI